ncbi:Phage tail protein I [Fulvimarina pelagi HTCC2506]|uniref:Phage tail protein I n=1 Tax=Fulvimarina pelagi HTCC2506 TaxID=314231 RepID=Q0FZ03_9HYPH|nr:phage tail protein [Fulvimarina pelagi]EAU40155.1 Phage tail protein I [Fulvimarina pelagi HTCC2506]
MSGDRLPSVSLPITKTMAAVFATAKRLAPLTAEIREIGFTTAPDDWVPWFIWDYGLEDVVPYVRDYRRVLSEGPLWQSVRGTPGGIAIGIGWVESEGEVAPSDQRHDWWKFQVGFEAPASDLDQIRQLGGIIRLSKASEDELFRMFSPGRDHRPVRMDMHRAGGGLMDGYSGEALWEGGPLISFGWDGSSETAFENGLESSVEIEASQLLDRGEGLRMDVDRFGGRVPALTEGGADIQITGEGYAFADDHWPDAWPESWAEAAEPQAMAGAWETL